MAKKVIVKLQIEGVHAWKNCDLPEVQYLKNEHRHVFHIRLEKEVKHSDRDIEIIMFKHKVEIYLGQNFYDSRKKLHNFGGMSCEMIAEELLKEFKCSMVEVLEDNENGAIVEK